jgi:hypothetical protein
LRKRSSLQQDLVQIDPAIVLNIRSSDFRHFSPQRSNLKSNS